MSKATTSHKSGGRGRSIQEQARFKRNPDCSRSNNSPQTTRSSMSRTDRLLKRMVPRSRVSTSRVLFLISLAGLAAILGYATFRILTDAEERLAKEQFESIADRALDMSLDIALRQRQGLITLVSIVEQAYPNADEWPFIDMNGFEVVANNVILTSTGQDMGMLPIVIPDQLQEFQTFAAPLYPETGVTTVKGLDENFQYYNETDGVTHWGSPHRFLAPFLYHSRGPLLFLANYHSIENRGRELDNILECSEERAQDMLDNQNNDDFVPIECSSITDIIDLSQGRNPEYVPAAVSYQPIYPANNPSELVGFMTSAIKWHDTLVNVFSSEVNGVHCVVETETVAYTYEVINGEPVLKSEGDVHDPAFARYGQSIPLNSPGIYSISSPNYTLSLYPTQDFFDVYATRNPINATVGAVCIVILTACIFFLYDFFVRKEFSHKKAMDKAKREFVRFISHEVRTPLNAVCMGLQLLEDEATRIVTLSCTTNEIEPSVTAPTSEDGGDQGQNEMPTEQPGNSDSSPSHITPSTEDQKENLQTKLTELSDLGKDILSNATSAVDVLNDMLNYDKVESGTLKLEITVFSIWELIEQTFSEFHQQAHFHSINYVLDFSALHDDDDGEKQLTSAHHLPQDVKNRKVVGDKVRISQVLRNLISNALKFTPENGTLTVRPNWKRQKTTGELGEMTDVKLHTGEEVSFLRCGDLQVEVADTGQGMTKDQLSHLFGEGVQFNVNKLQAGQGSGLGLYIAKGMLEQHGGSLRADSEGIGQGTVFTMTVPLYYVPDPPKPEQISNSQLRRRDYPLEKMEPLNLLVVDDSAMNRKMLTRLLENQGHVCTQAEDGIAAVEAVKNPTGAGKRYDAILMDYQMPNMDGPTAAREIRAMGCDSFIVGVTGNLFPEEVATFKDCGANQIFAKPLDVHMLMDTLVENGIGDSFGG